ncbi:MAG: CRTAC1 family protein [Chitinophagales bacterium]|nr:CRTAC1 family protein [Chitinophagales bacterium]
MMTLALENDTQAIFFNIQGNLQLSPIKIYNAGQTKMFLWVDYDNDGDSDIFITTDFGAVHLYENTGNFNFIETTNISGLSSNIADNYGASFADYDKDGFLDLHICKYFRTSGQIDSSDLTFFNNLYHNNGDGTFTDVSISSGVSNYLRSSFISVWFDYDQDSWPDLYVANDLIYDGALYRNNSDGTFSYETINANLINPGGATDYMTCSVADYNNDQDLDLFVSNTAFDSNGNPLLFDNDDVLPYFTNKADILMLEMPSTTWGGLWIDYDNDSYQDLYVATGSLFLDSIPDIVPGYFFKNESSNYFTLMDTIFTSNHNATSHAVAKGDLNRDGFHDIVVSNDDPDIPFLWLNSGNSNNHIKITLAGTVSNSMAIGSWIKVFVGGQQYTQYTLCGENYLGQNSQHHIFGLGQATLVDSVHIEYLSGIVDKYYNLAVNQNYQFLEGGTVPIFTIPQIGSTILCLGDSAVLSAPFFESYTWNTGDTTRQIEVWQAGNYSLTAIDSNGLINYSNVVEIDVLPDFIITANSQNMHCAELNDGEINLVVDNQGIPYTVEWNHGAIGDSLFNLNEGTYVFNYLDSFACQYTDSVQINAPFPINVQSLVSPQTPDTLGTISLNINGGFPPFQIFVDDVLSSTNINNLNAGFYSLEIIDENGCSWEQELEVIYLDSNTNTGIFLHDDPIFQVYPLPFKDHITLSFFSKIIEPFDLNLFSEEGRLIVSQSFKTIFGLNELRMEIAQDIPAGLYMLELRSQSDSSSKILIKF